MARLSNLDTRYRDGGKPRCSTSPRGSAASPTRCNCGSCRRRGGQKKPQRGTVALDDPGRPRKPGEVSHPAAACFRECFTRQMSEQKRFVDRVASIEAPQ